MRWVASVLLLVATLAHAQSTNPVPSPLNPIPRVATFFTDVVTWVTNEIYQENNEWMNPFIVQGCTAFPVPGLTHIPAACIAYTRGYRITENAAITYPDTSTCYVVIDPATSGNVTGINNAIFQRVGTSHYVINCDGSGAAGIAHEPMTMIVTTAGGGITTVVDVQNVSPVTTVVRDPADQSTTWTGPITVTGPQGEVAVHTTPVVTSQARTILAFVTVSTLIEAPTLSANTCTINVRIDGTQVNAIFLTNVSLTTTYTQMASFLGALPVPPGAHTVTVGVASDGDPGNECDNITGRTVVLSL